MAYERTKKKKQKRLTKHAGRGTTTMYDCNENLKFNLNAHGTACCSHIRAQIILDDRKTKEIWKKEWQEKKQNNSWCVGDFDFAVFEMENDPFLAVTFVLGTYISYCVSDKFEYITCVFVSHSTSFDGNVAQLSTRRIIPASHTLHKSSQSIYVSTYIHILI